MSGYVSVCAMCSSLYSAPCNVHHFLYMLSVPFYSVYVYIMHTIVYMM